MEETLCLKSEAFFENKDKVSLKQWITGKKKIKQNNTKQKDKHTNGQKTDKQTNGQKTGKQTNK